MRTTTAAALCAAALLTLTACSSSDGAKPDTAACKAALAKQLDAAMADGTKGEGRPDACAGIDAKTLNRLVGEVTEARLGEEIDKELGDLDTPPEDSVEEEWNLDPE